MCEMARSEQHHYTTHAYLPSLQTDSSEELCAVKVVSVGPQKKVWLQRTIGAAKPICVNEPDKVLRSLPDKAN
jgi:hypothetical protein